MSGREPRRPWHDRDVRRLLGALAFFAICLGVFVALRLVGLFH